MKILVDENIPYANKLFRRFGEVRMFSGRLISINELDDIDVLIVRSTTSVNKTLLGNKKIQFIGTATAGIDHIDDKWLAKAGIGFSAAPGCNAVAVVEYVLSSLLMLGERDSFLLKDRTIGIIGVGNIGRELHKRLEALSIRTLLCDPPYAQHTKKGNFFSLNDLVVNCDVLTFHTPLLKEGPHKSLHLVDEELIQRLKPGVILINTCRGPVFDNEAILKSLKAGRQLNVVLDVWEQEPQINPELLKKVVVGTPHIAGYTLEGKIRGIIQVFEAYTRFLGKPQHIEFDALLPVPEFSRIILNGLLDQSKLKKLAHLVYDVRRDDALLRKVAGIPGEFDNLRKHYIERREWSSLQVICDNLDSAALLIKLGFNAVHCPIY